jgi:hypothetical protein
VDSDVALEEVDAVAEVVDSVDVPPDEQPTTPAIKAAPVRPSAAVRSAVRAVNSPFSN